MGKKAPKSTRKFAAKGQLKKTIKTRQKRQQLRKKIQSRGTAKPTLQKADVDSDESGERKKTRVNTVDELLNAGFMDEESEDVGSSSEEEEDADEIQDDQSFALVDDLEDAGDTHLAELSKLAEKDPEFFKYLQENDRGLLEFDPDAPVAGDMDDESMSVDDDTGDGEEGGAMNVDSTPLLTKEKITQWQRALLEQRSLRALRRLLLAFRAAVHMNEEGRHLPWRIDSSSVYNKLVTTCLKFTPVVLEHHVPYKKLPNGKFKPPTQTPKLQTLQKLIQSYFLNAVHLLDQLTEDEMIRLAVTEMSKVIPWVTSSRRAIKSYLNKCLELWSSAEDGVRIAAFLAIKQLSSASDGSILDHVLKKAYLTFVRSCKSTSIHTLPSINLMKNTASDIFCMDHGAAYQHAFSYIRQLAIHLRESLKVKTKEAYKQVYNWQYAHCVDFWSIVLAKACEKKSGQESELKSLIFPLVQVSLGAVRLIPNARSFPFHLHIIRSLSHLTQHTHVYIPLAAHILPIVTTAVTPSSRLKPSTLRPLDLEVVIRAPQQHLQTQIYHEVLVEESLYVLAEWLSGPTVLGSIAFPELVVNVLVTLRRAMKAARSVRGSGKEAASIKALVERVQETASWVEGKRQGVSFGPGKSGDVAEWEDAMRGAVGQTPLGKYMKVLRTARAKRKALVEKARDGEVELLED